FIPFVGRNYFIIWKQSSVRLEFSKILFNIVNKLSYVMAAEGGSATLNCLYNTSASNHYLYWYRLEEGSSPIFILSRFKIGDGKTVEKRFSSSLDATARSVPLTIQDLRPSDSAVYYCALASLPVNPLKHAVLHSSH
uniref:Ig-like domain-containing protein n=1 Tax=Xiphophorus couchianus TaxID=32473 RepID=A0A3B5KRX8_9TELE